MDKDEYAFSSLFIGMGLAINLSENLKLIAGKPFSSLFIGMGLAMEY